METDRQVTIRTGHGQTWQGRGRADPASEKLGITSLSAVV